MRKLFVAYIALCLSHLLSAQVLEVDFKNPPRDARPSTYWMWMNGNITKEGLTADLEYMQRAGYGGAMMFNVGVGIPQGKIVYASKEWDDLTLHACKEAQRLGLELFLHNSPGYSGVGGSWITPDNSMQQLVWSEEIIATSKKQRINVQLPQPFSKDNYYRDIAVLAYPSPQDETLLFRDAVKSVKLDGKPIDKNLLVDGKLETKIRLENAQSTLDFELSSAFTSQAISIYRDRELPLDPHDGPRDYPANFTLLVSQDGVTYTKVATVACPALRAMDAPGIADFTPAKGRYFRLVTNRPSWICEVALHTSPRMNNWIAKTNYISTAVGFIANPQKVSECIDPSKVIDVTKFVSASGELTWKAPAGRWTIVRLGHTTTAEEPAASPTSSKGLECDKLSKRGIDKHFDAFLDPLLNKLKPYCGTTLTALMMDSWEAGKQNWTDELPVFFKQKRGYDIHPYLLALTGCVVKSVDETERFLWDFRRTNTDMFNENFLDRFKERAARFNLKFAGEPYGDGNFESMEYASKLDYPMSEFWTHYIYGGVMTTKLAASTAHVYGRKIVQAECFTGAPFNSKFTEHPYALKAEGDWMMTNGVNRFVYHTFAHQPYVGQPGVLMTMGPFGTHLDRNSVWAEQAVGWNNYNSRCAAMLQQGVNVADICFLKDEAVSAGMPDYDVAEPVVPYGYKWDEIDRNTLLNRISVQNGKIVLPDGNSYRMFVLPDMRKASPVVLRKIKELVEAGMTLVLTGKNHEGYMGLNEQQNDETTFLANELWNSKGFGKGLIIHADSFADIFSGIDVKPDFSFSSETADAQIHFIHRRVNDEDIYFVTNHRRRSENIVATFRVANRIPERWNAETGTTETVAKFQSVGEFTKVSLSLPESGSVFVVFRKNGVGAETVVDFASPDRLRYKDVVNTFSLSLWAKSETFAYSGRGFLIFPADGVKVFGKGHAALGLSMGQNGVKVFERSSAGTKLVLESKNPVEGWTLVNVVYENGIPILFLNGKKIAEGKTSGLLVHPSLEQPAEEEQYIASFEGDQTKTELSLKALTSEEIAAQFAAGLPKLALPNGATLLTELNTDWKVQFPAWSKAPTEIQMPELVSLHKSKDFNISHFSGTTVYTKKFNLRATALSSGLKIYLDLGRVENIAEVIVNGQRIGEAWKAPYRLDITNLLKLGDNELKIAVTNLLANRIIGDEHYAETYDYDEYGRIRKLPDWYINNKPKPESDKVIFAPWKFYKSTDPLLEAGLLGPVRIFLSK